jgi:ligand-binding SRPBCC domain-containing protein
MELRPVARIELKTRVNAPVERCFGLARDLDLHARTMKHTGETAIAGVTSGLIGSGEEVTWRARHFGFWHEHRSRIEAFDRPRHFRDVMVEERFASFAHDHDFEAIPDGTLMRDVLVFRSPFGLIGRFVDWLVLTRYLTKLLRERNAAIASAAVSETRGSGHA